MMMYVKNTKKYINALQDLYNSNHIETNNILDNGYDSGFTSILDVCSNVALYRDLLHYNEYTPTAMSNLEY